MYPKPLGSLKDWCTAPALCLTLLQRAILLDYLQLELQRSRHTPVALAKATVFRSAVLSQFWHTHTSQYHLPFFDKCSPVLGYECDE